MTAQGRRGFLKTLGALFAAPFLPIPKPVAPSMSVRFVRQYDIQTDQKPTRFDVRYGFATIRPDFAVRVHEA